MDFKPRILHAFPGNIPMPFFMTYPGYMGGRQEQDILRDLEYLQQAYPAQVKMWQKRVAEILDHMDYEGSMIYDEYPDRYGLHRLAVAITESLSGQKEVPSQEEPDAQGRVWMENMIQVLLCDEVYKRRHGGKRGDYNFLL